MDFSLSFDESIIAEEPPFSFDIRVDPDIPSLFEIVSKSSHILRHVPSDCRADFGRALTAVIRDVLEHNDVLAWSSYFLFAPVVLLPPSRAGKLHRKGARKHTKRRLKEWKGDDDMSLREKVMMRVRMWDELHVVGELAASDPVKRCKRLASNARYALACRALADSESLAAPNDHTFEILESKHPKGPPIPKAHNTTLPLSCTVDEVKAAIASFPSGSGAGPSKLSPDHLKDAAVFFLQTPVYDTITQLVNHIARGRAPLFVQPFLAGAFLSPLIKKDGGIRPVACGDTLRRIVGKVFAKKVKSKAKDLLYPFQLGVAVPLGAEAAIRINL